VGGNNFNAALAGAGTHAVNYRYTDSNGCSDTITINVFVDLCTGVETLNSASDGIHIYPNPAKEQLVIYNPGFPASALIVYDMLGNSIFRKQITNSMEQVINVSDLSPGIYFIAFLDEKNNRVIRKFIKL
jgi:hypothetical protein